MYKRNKRERSRIRVGDVEVGQTIEMRIEKILNNNEPVTDTAPKIYTERKDGVAPATNIRTDRFDIAVDNKHEETMGKIAKRNMAIEEKQEKENKSPDKGTE